MEHTEENKNKVLSRLKAVIAEILGIEENEINMDATFVNDMGADSLDMVELIMSFEKEFNIAIDDNSAEKIKTVQDAFNHIIDNAE